MEPEASCSSTMSTDSSLDRESIENDIAQMQFLGMDTAERCNQLEGSGDEEDDDDDYSEENDMDTGEGSRFPETLSLEDLSELPVNLDNCLFLNQLYQEFISESIERLIGLLDENIQEQRMLQEELNDVLTKKRRNYLTNPPNQRSKFLTIFATPYFKDKKGFGQPSNEDKKAKLAQQELDLYMKPPRLWSSEEKLLLRKAVKETALEHALQPLMIRKELLCEKLVNSSQSENETASINKRLEETNLEIEQTKSLSDLDLFGPREREHDWLKIGTIDFDGTRTAEECQLMWQNYLHPAVNKYRWTREEEANLRTHIAKFPNDWDTIAEELKTYRTAHQCMERYQSKLNDELLRTKWTPEEDQLLTQVVESCRLGEFIPWHQVCYYMEGRTRSQVYRRWMGHLSPDLAKGKWSLKEDMLLIAGVIRYGSRWSKIAQLIPGRPSLKARDRYVNSLDPTILFAQWSREEDEKLVQLHSTMGPKWAELARHLPGRTDSMVATRYRRLLTAEDELRTVPYSYQPNKCFNYRRHVYLKLLDIMKLRKEKQFELELRKQPDFNWVLKSISPKEADGLIERLQQYASKSLLKPGAKCTILAEHDKELINYFSVVMTPKPAGRPYAEVDVDEESEFYISVAAAQLKALGSEVKPSDISAGHLVSCQFGNPSVALLPATASTLNAFKALLLSRREFQNGTLLNKEVNDNDEEKQSVKRQKTYDGWKSSCSTTLQINYKIEDAHYAVLAARFASLFVWPALLSTLQPPREVDSEPKVKRRRTLSLRAATKRKYRKPWVSKRMRDLAVKRWNDKRREVDDDYNNTSSPPSTSQNSDVPMENSEIESTEPPIRKRSVGRPKGSKVIRKQVDFIPSRQSHRERKPTFKMQDT